MSEWIGVGERWPEEYETVLTYGRYSKCFGRWRVRTATWNGASWLAPEGELGECTHWMPMPDPPKEGEKC